MKGLTDAYPVCHFLLLYCIVLSASHSECIILCIRTMWFTGSTMSDINNSCSFLLLVMLYTLHSVLTAIRLT
jgi:hypothetical protein